MEHLIFSVSGPAEHQAIPPAARAWRFKPPRRTLFLYYCAFLIKQVVQLVLLLCGTLVQDTWSNSWNNKNPEFQVRFWKRSAQTHEGFSVDFCWTNATELIYMELNLHGQDMVGANLMNWSWPAWATLSLIGWWSLRVFAGSEGTKVNYHGPLAFCELLTEQDT